MTFIVKKSSWKNQDTQFYPAFLYAYSAYTSQFLYFDHLLQIVVGQKGQEVFGVLQDLRFDACIRYAHANP